MEKKTNNSPFYLNWLALVCFLPITIDSIMTNFFSYKTLLIAVIQGLLIYNFIQHSNNDTTGNKGV